MTEINTVTNPPSISQSGPGGREPGQAIGATQASATPAHENKARRMERAAAKVYRVLIVDDHPMLRRGLAELISHESDLGMCGEADDADAALELVSTLRPDLVVVDITLRTSNGLELVKQLRAVDPTTKILVCSMHDETLFAERALRAGAMGYINKDKALDDVVRAIRSVLRGEIYLSDSMADRILRRVRGGTPGLAQAPIDRLTDRELEVLQLIGAGLGTADIAERLDLSPKTVDAHRQKIKRKLDLESSSELTLYAVKWALEQTQAL